MGLHVGGGAYTSKLQKLFKGAGGGGGGGGGGLRQNSLEIDFIVVSDKGE